MLNNEPLIKGGKYSKILIKCNATLVGLYAKFLGTLIYFYFIYSIYASS